MSDSGGKRANDHGDQFRKDVVAMLLAHDFAEVGPIRHAPDAGAVEEFRSQCNADLRRPRRCFAIDVPVCIGLHDNPFRANFLLASRGWPSPLALMGRTQNSSGSACEKLEFLYATLNERMPCRSLVLLEGEQLTEAVFHRARSWVQRSRGRIARIFALEEFRSWLTEGSPYPAVPEQPSLGEDFAS